MKNAKKVHSISVIGRLTLDMHSLNNEGGEGNQIFTRQVNVVDGAGNLACVNAISGDMFKHIQAEHIWAVAKNDGLPLCAGCEKFDPNRISVDPGFEKGLKGKADTAVVDEMIKKCVIDDLEGNLITAANKNTPRKSVVEFGWVVGLPDLTLTDSYFHVKYVADPQIRGKNSEDTGANVGQNIFHRPASSGIYAVVLHLEASRISFNDIAKKYVANVDRKKRYAALIKSAMFTFLEPNGAMRNTQNPHVLGFDGLITVSGGPAPAPTVSPLADGYEKQVVEIAKVLGKLGAEVEVKPFKDLAEFAGVCEELIAKNEPYAWA